MPGINLPPSVQTTVNVGLVPFDTGPSMFDNPDQIGPIADYMIENSYERDGHVYVAGLSSPEPFNGSQVGVVKLANDVLVWVADWTACQLGKHPPVPDFTPPPGWVLLDVQAVLAMVATGPSEVDPIYRISGTYVYAKLSLDDSVFGDFTYPYAPWLKDGFTRKIPVSKLREFLLDLRGGSSGSVDGTTGGAGAGQGLTPPIGFSNRG